ncbi:hypothetical protein LOTGIDRAFT_235009 [Lottia gigantea]|uniref:TIR domain-containing protein n=1 Tax=Lottia gigantea TaxID=225164 RepID=V4BF55_LOTGI|nr:hypothetical protein LOTGIDRAFT_235009 [Lottia gigantea]ESO87514.1 hypothetical protein LOTGIDRAFT_235009 [Lottia gigantea]
MSEDLTKGKDQRGLESNNSVVVTINTGHVGLKLELPDDKKYHVFLYCENSPHDKHAALYILNKLEGHGIKCCFSERDFSPAKTQIRSITEAIEQSVKMVVIFSDAFFSGREGVYTAEMHLQTYIDKDNSLMIPLKIDDCTMTLPFKGILPIHILDLRREEEWFPNLIRSIADKTDNYLNMKVLASHRGCYSSKERKKLTLQVKFLQQLQKESFILDETIFNTMIKDIMNMYRDYRRPDKLFCPVLAYLCLICLMGVIFLFTTRYFQDDIVKRWIPLFSIFAMGLIFTVIMSCILRFNCQDCYHRSYKNDLAVINDKLMDQNIIVSVVADEIKLIYYNYLPCMEYLKEKYVDELKNCKTSAGEDILTCYKIIKSWFCCETPPYKNQDIFHLMLVKEAAMYACWYLRGKLTERFEERHTVQSQCLCQYIEKKWKLSKITHL